MTTPLRLRLHSVHTLYVDKETMNRKAFLKDYLRAFGAEDIRWDEENQVSIRGTVIYYSGDSKEVQDFVWKRKENELPSEELYLLVKILNKKKLLDVDRIRITQQELKVVYDSELGRESSESEFQQTMNELKSIQVNMLDEGVATDIYFIHE